MTTSALWSRFMGLGEHRRRHLVCGTNRYRPHGRTARICRLRAFAVYGRPSAGAPVPGLALRRGAGDFRRGPLIAPRAEKNKGKTESGVVRGPLLRLGV